MGGQYLVDMLQKNLRRVSVRGWGAHTTLRWVPGHKGNEENERADMEAKKERWEGNPAQTQYFQSNQGRPFQSARQPRYKATKTSWRRMEWMCSPDPRESPDYKRSSTHPHPPIFSLDPWTISQADTLHYLFSLRMGHIPLNKHLHRIRKKDSPLCLECRKEETVFHFLIEYKKYNQSRRKLEAKLNWGARSMQTLLSNHLAIPAPFQYINETGRFNESRDFKFAEEEVARWKEVGERKKGKKKKRKWRQETWHTYHRQTLLKHKPWRDREGHAKWGEGAAEM
jgi:hypothetical protein